MTPSAPLSRLPLIGCAGWTIPAQAAASFAMEGSHLERYAQRFNAVEINSCFYRAHRPATYRRWAVSVPDTFRFAVKMRKTVTHTLRLRNAEQEVVQFLSEVTELGSKLGCVLIQLPPSAAYESGVAKAFFTMLRSHYSGAVVCEPRHASWFSDEASAMLQHHRIGRVGADPAPHAGAAEPSGFEGVRYFRLHGSPRMYYDAYSMQFLQDMAARLRAAIAANAIAWCIFDNTALGHATQDALTLRDLLSLDSVTS